MARKRVRVRWLMLIWLFLSISHKSWAQEEASNTQDPNAELSMELLLFLAEWSEDEEWVDPIDLDRAMQESGAATDTVVGTETDSGLTPMEGNNEHH